MMRKLVITAVITAIALLGGCSGCVPNLPETRDSVRMNHSPPQEMTTTATSSIEPLRKRRDSPAPANGSSAIMSSPPLSPTPRGMVRSSSAS